MKLILTGHDRRWPVEQALFNYFGRLEAGEAVSSLHRGEKFLTCVTVITLHGQSSRGVARVLAEGGAVDHGLRRSFYAAARPLLPEQPPWGSLTGIRPAKLALKLADAGKDPARALRERYHVSPSRALMAAECARAAGSVRDSLRAHDVSLYVSIPFCPSRCAYCSFVSSDVEKSGGLIAPYLERLLDEIARTGALAKKHGRRVVSLYVGGGTPTTLSAAQLDALLGALFGHFDLSALRELTVEAGRPDTVSAEKFSILKRRGVDRVSVNPQTLSDELLRAIGRRHTAGQVFEAVALAREASFACLNTDLIAGLPGDTPSGFSRTLEQILALAPEHVTVHTLSVKKGSRFENDDSLSAQGVGEMLSFADESLRRAGYAPYYLYRQKFMSGGFENVGWRKDEKFGLYNLCMMEELHTVVAVGAGGASKLVEGRTGRIERVCHAKFPLEYLSDCDKLDRSLALLDQFWRQEDLFSSQNPAL